MNTSPDEMNNFCKKLIGACHLQLEFNEITSTQSYRSCLVYTFDNTRLIS